MEQKSEGGNIEKEGDKKGEASCGVEVTHTAVFITFHCKGLTHTHQLL